MIFKKKFLFGPNPSVPWAEKMVLNPAMFRDPDEPETIHMLFRATGAMAECRIPGNPLPYPIFLGYAVSRDNGGCWECDWSCPALAPGLKRNVPDLNVKDAFGRTWFDYSNGCIEDPRVFPFEGALYLSIACRAFPPGPYWEHDDPVQCMPDSIRAAASDFGRAVAENSTVSLLYRLDLHALRERRYNEAFSFVVPLHNPDISDDRDVVLFPRRLRINGSEKIVCIHRPKHPWNYKIGKELSAPSIFLALGDSLADFADGSAEEFVFAKPEFAWEANRVGASWAPLEIEHGLWVLPYHGKQDDNVGYTQSFMLLRERSTGLPEILVRPEERLLYAAEPWELEGDFTIPCLFTCSGILRTDGSLLMGYGAADAKVGTVSVDWNELCLYLNKKGNIV